MEHIKFLRIHSLSVASGPLSIFRWCENRKQIGAVNYRL